MSIGEITKWLFLLYGAGMILWSLFNHYRAQRAMAWPSVPGKILESSVRVKKHSEGNTYKPEILYEYSVQGKYYFADRWRFGAATSEETSKHTIARYPVGQSVTVFFDPENPADAVLEPGKTDWSGAVFGGVFTLIVLAASALPNWGQE